MENDKAASASREAADAATAKLIDSPGTSAKAVVPSQFPDKLMMLLEKGKAPDALWWLPDAGSNNLKGVFAINRKAFIAAKILDTTFNGNKWPSITRNLNRWGYKHVSYPGLPPHTTAYHNPLFQPNRPGLLKTMIQSKSQSKAAIQQLEMKQASTSSSSSPQNPGTSIGIPAMRNPATSGSTSSSSHQPNLRNSLMLAGVPAAAAQKTSLQQSAPLPPDGRRFLSAGADTDPDAAADTQRLMAGASSWMDRDSSQRGGRGTDLLDGNPNDSTSSGIDLFPNQQLQDVLLPNMTSTLDSQAMLQSILSRQEGLDSFAGATQQSSSSSDTLINDAALWEQLQRQEALLGLHQASPQAQTQLFSLQDQELQQLIQFQQQQQQSQQQQSQQQGQFSDQLISSMLDARPTSGLMPGGQGFAFPSQQALPQHQQQQQNQQQLNPFLAQLTRHDTIQQQQQLAQSNRNLQQASNNAQAAQQLQLEMLMSQAESNNTIMGNNAQQQQDALASMNEIMPLGGASNNVAAPADLLGSRGDAANQALSTLQQQEALINQMIRRRQQDQQNPPQQESPPQGQGEDCKPS